MSVPPAPVASAGRLVSVVLCSTTGKLLGTLPTFPVDSPWWPDVQPVVEGVRSRYGGRIVVLRLLAATASSATMGGAVTYLAEVTAAPAQVPLGPPPVPGPDHALRAEWARPGGVTAIVRRADERLAVLGRRRTGPQVQVKTWNLSCVLRLPTDGGPVWCKSVPRFLAHEGAVLDLVAAERPGLVPHLLGDVDLPATVLLADVPGEDQWAAPPDRLVEMVRTLVQLQGAWAGRVDVLLDAGVPDRRAARLPSLVHALLARDEVRRQLADDERGRLDRLAADLPARLAAIRACGLPDTLVHGDFHPGNWRSDGRSLVLLDWGDSVVGHPLLDLAAFLPRVPTHDAPGVRAAWLDAWRNAVPDSDPARAASLIPPVAALRQALVYQGFLDGIEPDERRYHEGDVVDWLRRAAQA